jgi:hypothetical protein
MNRRADGKSALAIRRLRACFNKDCAPRRANRTNYLGGQSVAELLDMEIGELAASILIRAIFTPFLHLGA